MPDWGIALTPTKAATVQFTAAPVPILLHTVLLIQLCAANPDALPGLAPYPREAALQLTDEQRTTARMMHWLIGDHLLFDYQHLSFPEFLEAFERIDAAQLRAGTVGWMRSRAGFPGTEVILSDFDTYSAFVQRIYAEKEDILGPFDADLHRRVWHLLRDPQQLKSQMAQFLRFLWEALLRDEWKRAQPLVIACVAAFEQQDYSRMSTAEIVEFVTARDLQREEFFEKEIQRATHITFAPSPYLGPYVTWMHDETSGRDLVFFGARQPRNTHQRSADLNRTELLSWLNALADETRLRMLEMLAREEEICAQDFITALELSQSSASRHLRQLTASGYLTERRRDVAKCYSLNRRRVEETIHALQQLLSER